MFFKPLLDLTKRLNELDTSRVIRTIVINEQDLEDLIIELNTQNQLFDQGQDSEGVRLEVIGGKYADSTIAQKQTDGLPFDKVTLFDTGAFYDSFEIVYKNESIVIEADTIKKDDDLRDRWGDNIIGLNKENIEKVIFFIRPLFVEFVLDYLLQDNR